MEIDNDFEVYFPNLDVLSFIENPFTQKKDNDILSILFHKIYRYTDIPVALVIFCLFSFVSAWLVKKNCKYKLPWTPEAKELNTWILLLAPSGCSKTLCLKQIQKIIPKDEENQPIIKPNIERPNGPVAMIQQLIELCDHDGIGRGFWVLDEAAQMLKQIENPASPMAEIKEYLLKIKDGTTIERHSAKSDYVVNEFTMTQFFMNTISSMVENVSKESMNDGLFRRYQVAIAERDQRDFTNYPLYRLDKIVDQTLTNKTEKIFAQNITGTLYAFNPVCETVYNAAFKAIWNREFRGKPLEEEIHSYYRTYMMESWKYAIFHHVINIKKGASISADSMEFGVKVVIFLLRSVYKFLLLKREKTYYHPQQKTNIEEAKIVKMLSFINENEGKKSFGMSAFYRKFHIKRDQTIKYLQIIKQEHPTFKTKLFKVAGLEGD